ncbi:MAG: PAS domain-containing protein [Acidobacteriota bacterium]
MPFGSELFALLRRALHRGYTLRERDVGFLISKVYTTAYSASTLYSDLRQLKRQFAAELKNAPGLAPEKLDYARQAAGAVLEEVFSIVLRRTSGACERIVEMGDSPICTLNRNGFIVYANSAMLALLGPGSETNTKLSGYFSEEEGVLVTEAIAGAVNRLRSATRELTLKPPNREGLCVSVCIQPLEVAGCETGAYATLVDLSETIRRQEKFLDRLALAAIKLDRDLQITYANPATTELLGTRQDIRGLSVYRIFPSRQTMSEEFGKRRAGQGSIYETEIVRPGDGKTIPVSVVGTPIMDDGGNYLGTLGIVRSLELEKMCGEIHRLIDSEADEESLLGRLARTVIRLIPFDYFGVTRFSLGSDHICQWFTYIPSGAVQLDRRWWPISAERKQTYLKPGIISNYTGYLKAMRPQWENDPDLKAFFDSEFQICMRIPIWQQDRLIAAINVLSKREGAYSPEVLDRLQSLPVEHAVQMAISYSDQREAAFRYDLFRQMARCAGAPELAQALADRLTDHYRWHHVSLFRVCEAVSLFRMVAEKTRGCEAPGFGGNQQQALTDGVLGHVYKTKQAVNIPDVRQGELAPVFVPGLPGARSELCIPVVWDNEVHWLLNVEDRRVDAFSKDEEDALGLIVGEAQLMLAGISREYLLESALQASSDAVLMTDTKGTIVSANPAAAKLLGFEKQSDVLGQFERIFRDRKEADVIFESAGGPGREIEVRSTNQTTVPVLISGSELPDDLSLKLFTAKDLRPVKRMQQLESLKKLFEEVAMQSHTPLALAETWVQRLKADRGRDPGLEWTNKLLGQLRKLEISYDRMALCLDSEKILRATEKQPLDLAMELKRIAEEFPDSEAQRLRLQSAGDLPYIKGDPAQIAFIFSSIISFLMRYLGPEDFVDIRVTSVQGAVNVRFSAPVPPHPGAAETARIISRAKFDLALGEPAIQTFAGNNSATYVNCANEIETVIELSFAVGR